MSMEEIMKEIIELRKDRERERELLEEIVMVAGTEVALEVALEAARRFDYKTHLYSRATYVNQLETFLSLLKKGIEKEIALDWVETNQEYVAEYLKNISEEPL